VTVRNPNYKSFFPNDLHPKYSLWPCIEETNQSLAAAWEFSTALKHFKLLLNRSFIVGLASPTLQPNGSVKQQSETKMFLNIFGFFQPANN
jgi:hypothetical protein